VLINGVDYTQNDVKICLSDLSPYKAYVVGVTMSHVKFKL